MNTDVKFLLGLLTGVGIGVALGILIAPEKGSSTYKKLEGAVRDAAQDLKSYGDQKLKKAGKKE